MSEIQSDDEFQATMTAYRAWCADYGHKLPSDGLGRHLFWAGWLGGRDWRRSQADAQAARIASLEAENERLTRYAAVQAASKRTWQQISENTAGEHDETMARVAELTEALAFYANIREYNPVGGDPPGSLPPIVTGDRGARARAALARDDDA